MLNKTKKLIFAALFIIATTAVCIYSIHQKELFKPASSVDFIMNTVVEQRLYGKNSEKAVQEVTNALSDFEKLLSTYVEGSEIDQINKAAGENPVKVSPTTMELLLLSKKYCESSDGLVDITIAPLILEWGITSDNPHIPGKETIDALLKPVNHKELILDEQQNTAMLLNKGQAIDLGAIAKGYSCDIFRRIAQENGITSGYASIGGNMVVIGKKPDGTDFRFGIRDPRGDESKYIGSLSLEGKTMATSGDYERFFMENGVRYHHILDPRTGFPAQGGLISVSVISENGALADFLSTELFIAGKEEALKKMNEPDYKLVLVDDKMNVYISSALEKDFIVNPNAKSKYTYNFVGGAE